jgi:hypothetical protein
LGVENLVPRLGKGGRPACRAALRLATPFDDVLQAANELATHSPPVGAAHGVNQLVNAA